MGFIECIFCKINHLVINFVCSFSGIPLVIQPGTPSSGLPYTKFRRSFSITDAFFLGHGTAHQIASSQRISCQISHDLHNLLLIYDTAVGRLQNRFKLRAIITDGIRAVLAPDILGNEIHGARTIKGNSRNYILQALRLPAPS